MLLYWGMFTVGFLIGSIATFMIFAPKKPEEDPEYETSFSVEGKSREIMVDQGVSGILLSSQRLNQLKSKTFNGNEARIV